MPSNLALYRHHGANRLVAHTQQLESRLERLKSKGEEVATSLVRTAEVSGAAFAVGLINGRYGGFEVLGLPIDLAAGVTLNVLAHSKVGGAKSAPHLHALGDGALAVYFATLGRGVGVQMSREATAPVPAPAAPAV